MKKYLIVISGLALSLSAMYGCHSNTGGSGSAAASDSSKINVLSFGGAFADAQRAAYYKPFQAAKKTIVTESSYDGEYGKLKAMQQTGNVAWDVVDVEASSLMKGAKEGLFLPIDFKTVDTTGFVKGGVDAYGVASDFYSVSLGFNSKKYPAGGPQPKSWADFWNTKKFPGARCMQNDPKFNLEIALMADGVPQKDIYAGGKLDVDRAFRKLDQIKPFVKVWWTTGQQPVDLLSNGEIDVAAAFGARIWTAKNKDKRPVDVTWNQSVIEPEFWCVLKGAKQPQTSMDFIAFASLPKQQAAFSKIFPLGPGNKNAFQYLDVATAKDLNTFPDNLKNQLVLNSKWWSEHESEILARWNSWLGKK
jgi:putative spermidine/putrescine transport system substrate-binding protein